MTIVGYSLNDTIIVFDRIREDVRLMRKSSFTEIINHALNVTLSRTMMTSGTTLLGAYPADLIRRKHSLWLFTCHGHRRHLWNTIFFLYRRTAHEVFP